MKQIFTIIVFLIFFISSAFSFLFEEKLIFNDKEEIKLILKVKLSHEIENMVFDNKSIYLTFEENFTQDYGVKITKIYKKKNEENTTFLIQATFSSLDYLNDHYGNMKNGKKGELNFGKFVKNELSSDEIAYQRILNIPKSFFILDDSLSEISNTRNIEKNGPDEKKTNDKKIDMSKIKFSLVVTSKNLIINENSDHFEESVNSAKWICSFRDIYTSNYNLDWSINPNAKMKKGFFIYLIISVFIFIFGVLGYYFLNIK